MRVYDSPHILPKGYTRSRSYGGFHCRKRTIYLALCRELLKSTADEETPPQSDLLEPPEPSSPKCPSCKVEMACIASERRPSWSKVFTELVFRERVYCPIYHVQTTKQPPGHPHGGYG